jgi:hypothetical protein
MESNPREFVRDWMASNIVCLDDPSPTTLLKNNCVQRKQTGKRTSNTRAPISDLKETRSLRCLVLE